MTIVWKVPGLSDLELEDRANGMTAMSFDLGWPQTRPVAEVRPGRDGTVDYTARTGGRVVSLQVSIVAAGRTRAANRDLIAARCHPSTRGTIEFDTDLIAVTSGGTRRIAVRCDQGAAIFDNPVQTVVNVTLAAPTGIIEAVTASTATVGPPAAAAGRSYPLIHSRTYPGPLPTIGTSCTNSGTMPAWPTATITGPVYGPSLTNLTTGQTVAFPGLDIPAGQTLVLDFDAGTALLGGSADRYAYFDFEASEWWQLAPGANTVVFDGDLISTPATAALSWRHAYFL